MAHKFVIKKDRADEYRAYFMYNDEKIFWTEGYTTKKNALNAIDSIKKNGPDAPVEDDTSARA